MIIEIYMKQIMRDYIVFLASLILLKKTWLMEIVLLVEEGFNQLKKKLIFSGFQNIKKN